MTGDRDAWLAERKRGIGGSDLGDLWELEPHGCLRRLYFDKANTPPDFPAEQTLLMRRGSLLEDAAALEYGHQTGRTLTRARRPIVHQIHTWARVNVDRRIGRASEPSGRGVLEIKTHGLHAFQRVKREGLKPAHILQLQHAIWVTGAKWGAFAVLHPDSWQMLHFDVERDQALIGQIQERGQAFWGDLRVSDGARPPALKYEPTDARCQACAWRRTCHGGAAVETAGLSPDEAAEALPADESLAELVHDYGLAKRLAADAADTVESIGLELKTALGATEAVACSQGRVYYRAAQRTTVDVKALRAAEPAIAEEYSRTISVRALRVYPIHSKRED